MVSLGVALGVAPQSSPKSLSGVFQEGTFFSPCQVVHLFFLHRSDGFDCLFLALGPSDYVLTVCHMGPLSVAASPSEQCVSAVLVLLPGPGPLGLQVTLLQ